MNLRFTSCCRNKKVKIFYSSAGSGDNNGGNYKSENMILSRDANYLSWLEFTMFANKASVYFIAEDGDVDDNLGSTFSIARPGKYAISTLGKVGTVIQIEVKPESCPLSCSGHGTCDVTTFQCQCDKGFFNSACSQECRCRLTTSAIFC
jgi:hypothetical protein